MIVRYINTCISQIISVDIANTLIYTNIVCYTLNILFHLLHFISILFVSLVFYLTLILQLLIEYIDHQDSSISDIL